MSDNVIDACMILEKIYHSSNSSEEKIESLLSLREEINARIEALNKNVMPKNIVGFRANVLDETE